MLIKPKDGARLGLGDPVCKVKTTEELTDDAGHEHFKTVGGKWFEVRREMILLSHVKDELQ